MQNNLPLFTPNQCDNLPAALEPTIGCETKISTSNSSFMKTLLHRIGMPGFILAVFLAGNLTSAYSQTTYTWNGTIDNDWNNTGNWATAIVPTSIDYVNITSGKPRYPILTSPVSCGRINQMSGASISATGAGSLTFSATGISVIQGASSISCPVTFSGVITFNISSGITLIISGDVSGSGGIIKTNNGYLELSNTTLGTLTNSSTAISGKITLGGTTTVNTLLGLTRGFIEIGAQTLIIKGSITHSTGNLRGSQYSNLTLNSASSTQYLYFDVDFSKLNNLNLINTSSSTVYLTTDFEIYGGISFGSNNDILDFAGNIVTLKSNAAGTAYVGEIKGQLLNATNVVAERYIDCGVEFTGKRAWRLLTIPVTVANIRDAWCGVGIDPNPDATGSSDPADPNIGTLITGHGYADGAIAAAAGYDWFQGLSSLTTSSIRYYSSLKNWTSLTNTPDITAAPDKEGYMLYVRGDRSIANNIDGGYTTLTPTGELFQGSKSVTVNESYTVVGNPYASPVSLDEIYKNSDNNTKITNNFWIWDATQGSSGGYRALSGDGSGVYTMTGRGGTAADYLVVNSAQAFFVEKNGAGGTITIEENDKVATTTPPVMFRPTGTAGSGVSKLDIKLFQATGSSVGLQADGVVGRYNNIYNVSPYETYDAAKLNNFNENLSLVRSGRYMSIESRPYPTQKDTLFISFWGLKNRDYAFTITSSMFAGLNQTAKLVDNFTNTQTILDLSDAAVTYPFSVTSNAASSSLNRFMIVMAPSTVLPVTFTKINAALLGSKVQVSWATGSELGVKNYSVERSADGTHFNKIGEVAAIIAANGSSYQFADNQPLYANNYYRIRSNDADGKYAYSNVAAVQLNAKKGMQVMPTVISNQRFTLNLNDQPVGNYQLKITNTAGQQVFQKLINNLGGSNTQVIELGNSPMPTGVYNLSVSGLNGVNQNFRLLINN